MEYYIYHIPNIKIGCSTEPDERVKNQGYSNYEILEQYNCIDTASKREQELQKEYGYPVDIAPYSTSVRNRPKWNDKTRFKIWEYPELCAKSSKKNVKKAIEWHKNNDYKVCIQNLKNARKPHILSEQQEQFIIDNHFKAKNQNSKIPKDKFTTKQLAIKFSVKENLIRAIVKRAK